MPKENKFNQELRDLISNGIVVDIFEAEEIYAIEEYIGLNANKINQATYGQFFGSLQRLLNRHLILSVSRIFEVPKGRYKIRSIPSALKFMRHNANSLSIPERPSLINELTKLGLDSSTLNSMNDIDLTNEVINYFESRTPKPDENSHEQLDHALQATKTLRDKSIAHPEVIEFSNFQKPSYIELKDLINIAKDFVSLIGLPYLSIAYRCDRNDYLLSSDAKRSQRCLKRILENLEIKGIDSIQ